MQKDDDKIYCKDGEDDKSDNSKGGGPGNNNPQSQQFYPGLPAGFAPQQFHSNLQSGHPVANHLGHSPPPNPTTYYKDERTQRQHIKLKKKLHDKQQKSDGLIPRKELVNGLKRAGLKDKGWFLALREHILECDNYNKVPKPGALGIESHFDRTSFQGSHPVSVLNFITPACEPDQPQPPKLLNRTKNSLQLSRGNAGGQRQPYGAHL
ncbi:unnamed protein product [Diabrotica balteata]|uniref:Uncharacterized protein n=1 Tax=Diabrotica balteata TaxID=107213 RepID=A0A9N9T2B0_DIABA|nr:unnamed protein product [Diabrotica balteata]